MFAGLVGGITWNLLTWLLGIPSSSSHALIGGVIGAMLAAVGSRGVEWKGVVSNVVLPGRAVARSSPAWSRRWAPTSSTARPGGSPRNVPNKGFRAGQIGSASLVSLAHGTNDAQKTMGIIFLALISYGSVDRLRDPAADPGSSCRCASAIALGTYLGGWRIIRTLGKGLVEIEPPQGMAAEASSAAVILLASHFGYSLSTTHVATGSILGTGVGKAGRGRPLGSGRCAW